MKELDSKLKDKTELSVQKKQQIERELVGRIIPHPGHKVFEICLETLKIEEAMYIQNKTLILGENPNQKKEVLVREGFAYVSAMNKENAMKKFLKGKSGSKQITNSIIIK